MKQLPTAEELFKKYCNFCQFEEGPNQCVMDIDNFKEAYMEGVKYHIEAALKQASEKVILDYGDYISDGHYERIIDKDSILNSYPLNNIIV